MVRSLKSGTMAQTEDTDITVAPGRHASSTNCIITIGRILGPSSVNSSPGAVLFSDVGPDVRWVGNEKGIAGEPCWATYTPRSQNGGSGAPGDVVEQESTSDTRNGKYWMPAECDVSIRPGWFWHPSENTKVKTARELLDLYVESVGRGASFLLNIPPDRRGLIYETDADSLRGFGKLAASTFARNLALR